MNCLEKDGLMVKALKKGDIYLPLSISQILDGTAMIQMPLLVAVSRSCVVDCTLRRGFSASRFDEKSGQAAS